MPKGSCSVFTVSGSAIVPEDLPEGGASELKEASLMNVSIPTCSRTFPAAAEWYNSEAKTWDLHFTSQEAEANQAANHQCENQELLPKGSQKKHYSILHCFMWVCVYVWVVSWDWLPSPVHFRQAFYHWIMSQAPLPFCFLFCDLTFLSCTGQH